MKRDKQKEQNTENKKQKQMHENENEKEKEKEKEINNTENNINKEKKGYNKLIEEIKEENTKCYISKISEPILKKKYYKKLLKILDYIYCAKMIASNVIKSNLQLNEKEKNILKKKFIEIGLSHTIKSIKKGNKGIVIIAIDIYPINIVCHLPAVCEKYNVYYTYLTTKSKLANLCKLRRSVTCLFILEPIKEIDTYEKIINENNNNIKLKNFTHMYEKLLKGVKNNHPYFN